MTDNCLDCGSVVRKRQEAVTCDACDRWQHRKCNTGISQTQYRDAMRGNTELLFTCRGCQQLREHDTSVLEESMETEMPASVESMETTENEDSIVSVECERSYQEPNVVHNRSYVDKPPSASPMPDIPITFELIAKGSQHGKDLLEDSHGYCYVIKERRPKSTVWRCSVRNKAVKCPAGVIQRQETFTLNSKEHVHAPVPERGLRAKITAKAKATAAKETMRPASDIVEEASNDLKGLTSVGDIRTDYVARVVNRYRQDLRPEEPLDESAFPENFYRKEVKVDERRHLIFATDEQLDLLTQARRWYIDGTFKVMRAPFIMLLTIHAFVRRGDCSKQVPLVFVAMTGRTSTDYEHVLKAIKRGLRNQQEVEEVVCDFEKAIWKAMRRVFPTILMKGCSFHWGQAVWRHIQSLGLSTEYMNNHGTYSLLRMIFCLPFLPAEHIIEVFDKMEDFNTSEHIEPLFQYLRRTWFESSTWTVQNWSVFGQSVRTNNDCEGWHRRLNVRAGVSPPFYNLIKLLYKEARFVESQVRLVSEMKLRRLQRKAYRSMQSQIFQAWDSYRAKQLSATALLKKVSSFYQPRVLRQEAE